MHYDRGSRRTHRRIAERVRPRDYNEPYDSTFHGYAMGYGGGALRSRGSYEAGQVRSGRNPRDEFEFEWGDGYIGGRGYGGTNYDLTHGYQVGGMPRQDRYRSLRYSRPPSTPGFASPTTGSAAWSEEEQDISELFGPARYGYGPYYERLRRQRRADNEIQNDVEEALFYDTWVDADRIEVSVDDGIVTLSGTLPNFDEVRFATDDAWDVDGVRGVRSEFEVGPIEGEAMGGGAGGAAEEEGTEPRGRGAGTPPGARGGAQPQGMRASRRHPGAGERGRRVPSRLPESPQPQNPQLAEPGPQRARGQLPSHREKERAQSRSRVGTGSGPEVDLNRGLDRE